MYYTKHDLRYGTSDACLPRSPGVLVKPHHLEFLQGRPSKFWEVSRSGNTMTLRWDRIGSTGQSKTKTFANEQAAADVISVIIGEQTAEALWFAGQRWHGVLSGNTL